MKVLKRCMSCLRGKAWNDVIIVINGVKLEIFEEFLTNGQCKANWSSASISPSPGCCG